MQILLQQSQSGLQKKVKVGFSWTTLFFGAFPALLRGDLKWMIIMFICSLVTLGLSLLVFPFTYNKTYIKGLLEKGYAPLDESGRALLSMKGIPLGAPIAADALDA